MCGDMKLPLAYYTDPVLRKKAERVNHIDDELRQFVADMIETMHATKGIGLAAPQVHRSLSLFVTCVPVQKPNGEWAEGQVRVFINPEIISSNQEMQSFTEGCLSLPKLYVKVTRPSIIKIKATDLDGNPIEETMTGFTATNFMHENDHLNGVLIVDHLNVDERKSILNLLKSSLE